MQPTTNIPQKLAALLGQTLWGPNCWNATAVYHEPNREIEYMDVPAKETWLAERTIKISAEDRQSGDILVLRWNSNLHHTAIWLDENEMLFHKYGFGNAYEFVTYFDLIDDRYPETTSIEWRRYVGIEEEKKAA